MAAVLLTDKTLGTLTPRAAAYYVRDAKVSGLELKVRPDGAKTWTLRYRHAGQQKRLTLGPLDPDRLGLAAARKRANAELRKIDAAIDPAAEREAAKAAAAEAKRAAALAERDSIEALCDDYIERHAKVKKRTWRADQSMLNVEIKPAWKGRPVTSITRRDCRALVQAVADRPAPIFANRIVSLLSRLFRFAVDEEIIDANIASKLPRPGVEAAQRPDGEREEKPYTDDEIRRVWAVTADLPEAVRALYRVNLLTGQRPGEVAGMAWSEIAESWWTIPGARTKNKRPHRVYLTPLTLAALADVPKLDGVTHVFAGLRGAKVQREHNAVVFAGCQRRKKPRHALRDTAATGMAAAGVPVDDVSRVLNHTVGLKVTGTYNAYAYDREKRLALSKWERRLRQIIEHDASAKKPAKVVAIAAGRR